MSKTFRLQSSDMVGAPGLIVWAINGYAFPDDRPQLLNVVTETWKGVPPEAAEALLLKKVPYKVEDDAVVFEFKPDPALAHLREALTKLITGTGATEIVVDDGEDETRHPASDAGIAAAASWAKEVDGIILYEVGNALLKVLYDGPYDDDNAAEIINDCNTLADQLIQ